MFSVRMIVLGLLLNVACASASVADENLSRFFGAYSGFGFAQDTTGPFINTERQFAMAIGPLDGGGFEIIWQTVKRKGRNPNDLDASLSQHELQFRPGGVPGHYHGMENGNPLTGGLLSWAKQEDDFLTIYSFVIEDGVPELHTYHRMWTAKGLELYFTAVRDGEVVRTVRGRYERQ